MHCSEVDETATGSANLWSDPLGSAGAKSAGQPGVRRPYRAWRRSSAAPAQCGSGDHVAVLVAPFTNAPEMTEALWAIIVPPTHIKQEGEAWDSWTSCWDGARRPLLR